MSDEYEYRVVCADGSDSSLPVTDEIDAAARAAWLNENDPAPCAPHRVQRRRITEWENVDE